MIKYFSRYVAQLGRRHNIESKTTYTTHKGARTLGSLA